MQVVVWRDLMDSSCKSIFNWQADQRTSPQASFSLTNGRLDFLAKGNAPAGAFDAQTRFFSLEKYMNI